MHKVITKHQTSNVITSVVYSLHCPLPARPLSLPVSRPRLGHWVDSLGSWCVYSSPRRSGWVYSLLRETLHYNGMYSSTAKQVREHHPPKLHRKQNNWLQNGECFKSLVKIIHVYLREHQCIIQQKLFIAKMRKLFKIKISI